MKGRRRRSPPQHAVKYKNAAYDAAFESDQGVCGPSPVQMSCIVGAVTFSIYVYTLYPSLPGGDSGELITAAHEFGVAHPPGYPLFTVLSWLMIHLFPFGSVAWRVNLLNAVFASMAAVFMTWTIIRLTKNAGSAIFGTFLFCFSKLTWTWSITAEVFSLNNLFTTILVCRMLIFTEALTVREKRKATFFGAFVCGLALCNQHTIVVYVFVIAIWVAAVLWCFELLTVELMLKVAACFLCGLLPYLYLPLSGYLNCGRWTWGDNRTLEGFLTHLFRVEYGTFQLGKDQTGSGFGYNINAYASHAAAEFTTAGMLCIICGIVASYYRFLNMTTENVFIIFAMALLYSIFFAWRANLDISNPLLLGVVERFWMQADVCLCFVAAMGFSDAFKYVKMRLKQLNGLPVEVVIATGIALYQIQRNFPACNQRNNTVIQDFAVSVLESFPADALVLTKGDLPSNALRYMNLCENVRPDVQIFDQEVMTYQWSVSMMRDAYPRIQFPGDLMYTQTGQLADGRTTFDFKTFLDANYNMSSIFACIGVQDHEHSWKFAYHLIPFGMCSLFVKLGENLSTEKWSSLAKTMSQDWSYSFKGFDPTTWEKIATDEMWNAKISWGYYLYDLAENTKNIEQKKKFLNMSYKLYTEAIENNTEFPPYWHKNYALVCNQMLQFSSSLDKLTLIQKAIDHFDLYSQFDLKDASRPNIMKAIASLREHLKLLQKEQQQ